MPYAAKNLEDIAEAFELRAWQASAFSDRLHKTKRDKMLAERERQTWQRAADMLRETTLEARPNGCITNRDRAKAGLQLLQDALKLFDAADNRRTVERVRGAISSARGAVRIQEYRERNELRI